MPILHVVIPVYNEASTLEACLRRVVEVELPAGWSMNLHLVDDHSDAPTARVALDLASRLQDEGHALSLQRHEVNRGKGAAVQTGLDAILRADANDDDLVIIQDADLEYDPTDFVRLIEPIVSGRADAVVGTRWGAHRENETLRRRVHALGNRGLTLLSNLMTGYRVTDMECCYKVFPVEVVRRLRAMLSEQRFGIEPQIVAGLARLGERVEEVPVSYRPRNFQAGKKIGWIDGVRAVYVIARERLRPAPANPRREPEP